LLVALAAFVALTFSAAGISAAFAARSVRTWYVTLRKPAGNPPRHTSVQCGLRFIF
jgi:tryptophan-rich sensory protein